ncbi:unnamed protein product, partial [Mesorhabditis spiculigera]
MTLDNLEVPSVKRLSLTNLEEIDIPPDRDQLERLLRYENQTWLPQITIEETLTEGNCGDALERFNGGPVRHVDFHGTLPPKTDTPKKVTFGNKCKVYIVYEHDPCRAGGKLDVGVSDKSEHDYPAASSYSC